MSTVNEIPENEKYLHEKQNKETLEKALAWDKENPIKKESNLDELFGEN